MNKRLERMVEQARKVRMTEPQAFEQRISFAFGTAKIENDNVTREMVVEAASRGSSSEGGTAKPAKAARSDE
jgi:hypothetical protein